MFHLKILDHNLKQDLDVWNLFDKVAIFLNICITSKIFKERQDLDMFEELSNFFNIYFA